jgi:hypothetical protein
MLSFFGDHFKQWIQQFDVCVKTHFDKYNMGIANSQTTRQCKRVSLA